MAQYITRLYRASEGGSPPIPQKPLGGHILHYGQSLCLGVYAGGNVWTYQPAYNRMFSGGPEAVTDASMTGTDWLHTHGNEEAPCAAMGAWVSEHASGDHFYSTCGHEAYHLSNLKKGSAWYAWAKKNITNAADRFAEEDRDYTLEAIAWMQGFQDQCVYLTGREYYRSTLIQLREDLEAEAETKTGDPHTVPMLIYQTSCGHSEGNHDTSLAQLDASQDDANIHMVGPNYFYPRGADGIHLTPLSYALMGCYYGRAYCNLPWTPLEPTAADVSGQVVTVDFDVPVSPLVLDTVTLPEATDKGFSLYDDGGQKTITGVALNGQTSVDVTFSGTLGSNPVLQYGFDYLPEDWNLGGNYGGAIGNLRDSSTDEMIISREDPGTPMYNWCCHFEWAL